MLRTVKRVVLIIFIVILALAAFVWYRTPVSYPVYEEGSVSKIIIRDNASGNSLYVVSPTDVAQIMDQLSGMELQHKGIGITTPENCYEVTLYNDKNLEIIDFNPLLILDSETIQSEPLTYSMPEGSTLYQEISTLFETAVKE